MTGKPSTEHQELNLLKDRVAQLERENQRLRTRDAARTEVEIELRACQQKFNELLKWAPVGIFWKDRDLIYTDVSPLYIRQRGFNDANQLIGKRDSDIAPETTMQRLEEADKRSLSLAKEKTLIDEIDWDGESDVSRLRISRIPLTSTQQIQPSLLGFVQDMTKVRKLTDRINRLEIELQTLYDHSMTILVLVNEAGHVVRSQNNAMRERLSTTSQGKAITPGEAVSCFNHHSSTAGCGHTPHCQYCPLRAAMNQCFREQTTVLNPRASLRLQRSDGINDIHFIIKAVPVKIDGSQHAQIFIEDQSTKARFEATLNRWETAFNEFYRQAPINMVEVSCETGAVQRFSDHFREMSGFSSQELEGRLFASLFHKESRAVISHMIDGARSGEVTSLEHCLLRCKNGERLDISVTGMGSLDTQAPPALHCFLTDITDIRRTWHSLEKTQARFKNAILNSPYPTMIHAEDGEIISLSKSWTESCGYTLEETPSVQSWLKAVMGSGEQVRLAQSVINTLYSIESRVQEGELIIHCRNGQLRTWDFSTAPLGTLNDGRRLVMSVASDLTARIEAEKALKLSSERLRRAQHMAHVGSWEWNFQTQEISWTDELARLIGCKPSITAQALLEQMLALTHADDREALKKRIDPRTPHEDLPPFEFRLMMTEQEQRWIRNETQLIRNPAGEIIHRYGTFQDITEIKAAQLAISKAKEAAEQASQAKSDFLAKMSHEIRTPMNAVLGFTEILSQEIENKAHLKLLGYIQSSGKSLLNLINDILDLSKIEAGMMELYISSMSLSAMADEIAQLFALQCETKGLDFRLDLPDALPEYVLMDDTRLRQMLINLVSNAIKFTNEGSVSLRIDCQNARQPNRVNLTFAVSDTGCGIALQEQQNIFTAFHQQRGQDPRQYGGTGLGLAITHRLAQLMGGSIRLESEPGRGSTFIFNIPDIPITHVAAETPAVQPGEESHYQFKPATILVVDDVPLNRKLIEAYLAQFDFTVLSAENGQQAIQQTLEHHPDLIFMDIKMPVMNGYEATRHLKDHKETADIPIVALTAYAMKGSDKDLELCGCDSYVHKPITQNDLVAQLLMYLEPEAKEFKSAPRAGSPPVKENAEIKNLPALLKHIEEHILPEWKNVKRKFIIHEIEVFAERVLLLGEEYGSALLLRWGEEVRKQAQTMELEQLPGTLEGLTAIISQLATMHDREKQKREA